MPTYIETWDETKPAGSRDLALGDDDIREFKRAMRERFAADHYALAIEGTDDKIGYHSKATLLEQASDPLAYANSLILYSKLNGSFAELFNRHENAGIQRLTNLGKLWIDALGTDSEVRGDIILRGASTWGRYPLGVTGNYLRSNGTDLVYSNLIEADITTVVLTPKEYTDVEDTSSSDEAAASSSYGDTTLSITFTVGKQGLVFASFEGLADGGGGYGHQIALVVDGTVKKEWHTKANGQAVAVGGTLVWHGVLSAGSHTIKIQHKRIEPTVAGTLKGTVCTSRLNVSHPS
jgi:hypothetical protein